MAYYHILIQVQASEKKHFELDETDLSEIKEDIIIPYLKGEQFLFDGYTFDKEKIQRILIKESNRSSKEYAEEKNRNLNPNIPLCFFPHDIVEDDECTTDITKRTIRECKEEATPKSADSLPNKPKAPIDKSKVFIVHGHDNAAKEAVARFIEKIGLQAIILHEQASSGQTIIEKIEANSNVGFGIVLYTPCDLGAPQEQKENLKPRARQNVVFEHGYLIGKIGRKNVCALVKGDIETPNDISGVVYIKMDEGDSWKSAVAREMKACDYEVDLNKI